MTTDLVAQLTNEIRGDRLDRVASALGESPAKIESALGAVLPAILLALASRASTITGAGILLDHIRLNQLDSARYRDATSAIEAHDGVVNLINAGRPVLDAALGGRTSAVVDWISSHVGLNRSSAISLLTITLPLVVGQLVRHVGPGRLNGWNLHTLLTEQRGILAELPGLSAALGVVTVRKVQALARAQDRSWTGWWEWPLRLALILLIPLVFSLGRPADPRLVGQSQVRVAQAGVAAVDAASIAPAFSDAGIESRLVALIEDPNARVDEQTSFILDRVEFETGSAILKPSSHEQLRNITVILNAYPNVHVKIAGYTDDAGDAARNLKLSTERAIATLDEIARGGIDRSRLEVEGLGARRNSRIDIRVTGK